MLAKRLLHGVVMVTGLGAHHQVQHLQDVLVSHLLVHNVHYFRLEVRFKIFGKKVFIQVKKYGTNSF